MVKVKSILWISVFSGVAKVRSQCVQIDFFHFLWFCDVFDISIFRKKTYGLMLAYEYNVSKLLFQNFIFAENTLKLSLVISWERATKIWKKFQEFILVIRETRYVKMKDFLNHHYLKYAKTVWFLQKMALKYKIAEAVF